MIGFDPDAALDRLESAFGEVLAETSQGGASLALWHDGKPLLSLHGGEASQGIPWTATTPCLIWSASKGVAACCALQALQEKNIPLETRVSDLWPEFRAAGKERIILSELLSHRAGLAAIDRKGLAITDHEAVAEALAAQPPNWPYDGTHGYGARTFGFLLDEIVRRITGERIGDRWERLFRAPLGLELWFGMPPDQVENAATVISPKVPPTPGPFSKAFGDPSSLTRRALSEPNSKLGTLTPTVMNTPAMRSASLPSLGAIATADSLARLYSLLACDGGGIFQPETLPAMRTTLAKGPDRVLIDETSFSAGFMTNEFSVYGPSHSAFGHPGAGGSLAFANPEHGIGFAFIPSAMNPGALPGPRTKKLVAALYGTVAE
jgi:CubicO group peptidase (beta-lactamase class C family)